MFAIFAVFVCSERMLLTPSVYLPGQEEADVLHITPQTEHRTVKTETDIISNVKEHYVVVLI